MNTLVCVAPPPPTRKGAVAGRYFKEIVVYITAAKITRSFQKESQLARLVLQYQTPRRGGGEVSLFSTLPLYLDVKYIPWERKTFNQQIPWTHTHTHTCAFFPFKPQQWPEHGTAQSAAAVAGELEVWWEGRSPGRRCFGCDTYSRRCWCQPVTWGGETCKQPAAGEVVIGLWLRAPP